VTVEFNRVSGPRGGNIVYAAVQDGAEIGFVTGVGRNQPGRTARQYGASMFQAITIGPNGEQVEHGLAQFDRKAAARQLPLYKR